MKTYFGYIRVSTAKQGHLGSSLQEQRDAILAFATRHGLTMAEWYEDRETAAKKGRTQFMRMMTALEKHKAAGVILHKIDRGARNLWDWARLQDLIDRGVAVHFAHDNLDLNSRGGRLAADIQAVVAADYVRNLRDEVRKGILGRLKQGLYPGRAPVGYLDTGKAKPKTIDPIKGPLVRAAFDLYATRRYSYYTLAEELHRRGLRRASGKPLSFNGIMTMLRNPFYTGIIRVKRSGEVFQGIHEPLVSSQTFKTVQDIIDGKGGGGVRRFDFAYRRLLKCGHCASALTGEFQKGRVYYRCHTRTCATTGIREDAVTNGLKSMIAALGFTQADYEEIRPYVDASANKQVAAHAKARSALNLRLSALEERDHRLTDAYLDGALDRDTYLTRKAALIAEQAEARENLGAAQEQGDIVRRFEELFELAKRLELGPEIVARDAFRDSVEFMTSNWKLTGKSLAIAMRSPFQELLGDTNLPFGDPCWSGVRTLRLTTTPAGKGATVHPRRRRKLSPSRRVKVLVELAAAMPRKGSPRKMNASWFKRKEPPVADATP